MPASVEPISVGSASVGLLSVGLLSVELLSGGSASVAAARLGAPSGPPPATARGAARPPVACTLDGGQLRRGFRPIPQGKGERRASPRKGGAVHRPSLLRRSTWYTPRISRRPPSYGAATPQGSSAPPALEAVSGAGTGWRLAAPSREGLPPRLRRCLAPRGVIPPPPPDSGGRGGREGGAGVVPKAPPPPFGREGWLASPTVGRRSAPSRRRKNGTAAEAAAPPFRFSDGGEKGGEGRPFAAAPVLSRGPSRQPVAAAVRPLLPLFNSWAGHVIPVGRSETARPSIGPGMSGT